jgi:hypothetical protein
MMRTATPLRLPFDQLGQAAEEASETRWTKTATMRLRLAGVSKDHQGEGNRLMRRPLRSLLSLRKRRTMRKTTRSSPLKHLPTCVRPISMKMISTPKHHTRGRLGSQRLVLDATFVEPLRPHELFVRAPLRGICMRIPIRPGLLSWDWSHDVYK